MAKANNTKKVTAKKTDTTVKTTVNKTKKNVNKVVEPTASVNTNIDAVNNNNATENKDEIVVDTGLELVNGKLQKDETVNNEIVVETPVIEIVNTNDVVENEKIEDVNEDDIVEDIVNTANKDNRFSITLQFDEKEGEHLKKIIGEHIKFGIVTNKSDFAKLAIDFAINHNAVIKSLQGVSPIQFPYPDGTDGSENVEPKLLKKSLFTGKVNIASID